jgi:hypothetical protein
MSANDAPANDAYNVSSCKHSVTTVAVYIRPRIVVSGASASRIRHSAVSFEMCGRVECVVQIGQRHSTRSKGCRVLCSSGRGLRMVCGLKNLTVRGMNSSTT